VLRESVRSPTIDGVAVKVATKRRAGESGVVKRRYIRARETIGGVQKRHAARWATRDNGGRQIQREGVEYHERRSLR